MIGDLGNVIAWNARGGHPRGRSSTQVMAPEVGAGSELDARSAVYNNGLLHDDLLRVVAPFPTLAHTRCQVSCSSRVPARSGSRHARTTAVDSAELRLLLR